MLDQVLLEHGELLVHQADNAVVQAKPESHGHTPKFRWRRTNDPAQCQSEIPGIGSRHADQCEILRSPMAGGSPAQG